VDGYTPVAAYVGNGGWIWGMIRQCKVFAFLQERLWCSRLCIRIILGKLKCKVELIPVRRDACLDVWFSLVETQAEKRGIFTVRGLMAAVKL